MNLRRSLAVLIGCACLLFLAAWAATPLPAGIRIGALNLLWLAGSLSAGIACLGARGRPENAELRRSFTFLAAAAFVWSAGQAVWAYQELVQGVDSPVFALADVGFALSVPLQAGALLVWPLERTAWEFGRILDFTLIAGFATLFGIELILRPLLELEVSGAEALYAVLYPPSEILLFGVVLAAFTLTGWRERARLELIAFTLLLLCLADSAYTYLGHDYKTGGLLDPLWMIGFAGVGLVALAPAELRGRRGWIAERVQAVAPSVALFVVASVGITMALSGRAPLGSAERASVFALVLVLAARQAHIQLRLLEQMAEQRRLQEQLQHAQKLEAVGRLAGGVAHDFNNLLTAIDGYSELALQRLAPNHPVRSDLDEVRRAAGRASGLTRKLLAFSRRQVFSPRVVDLSAVVREAEQMLRRLMGSTVELETTLAGRPALVHADPGQLEQVITNLVLNARDAMPGGGTVRVETGIEGARVRLAVEDEGIGMDDDTRARLFEPFYTTKEPGKGTGLGLAVVHGIAMQSGAEIAVQSVLGRGSRFELVFGLASADDGDDGRLRSAESAQGTETVLLVEDEPAVREIAQRMLELAGYSVVTAASGDEAIRIVEQLPPIDVLLTDIVMPGLSGVELAATLCARFPGLPVVLMAGYTGDTEPLEGLPAGRAAFLEKPFTGSALVAEVRAVLDAAA